VTAAGTVTTRRRSPGCRGSQPRSFERQFEEQQQAPIRWKALVKRSSPSPSPGGPLPGGAQHPGRVPLLAQSGPPQLPVVHPAVLAEGIHFACTFSLQRIALRTKAWFSVITAQLSGNAISLIVPGGAAPVPPCSSGCWARPGWTHRVRQRPHGLLLLGIGGLLALPVFVLPVVAFGAPVASGCRTRPGSGRSASSSSPPSAQWSWPPTRHCCGPAGAQAVRNRALKKRPRLEGYRNDCSSSATSSVPCWASSGGRPPPVGGAPPVRLPLPAVLRAGRGRRPPTVPDPPGLCRGRRHRPAADHPGASRGGSQLAGFLALAGLDGAQAVLATLATAWPPTGYRCWPPRRLRRLPTPLPDHGRPTRNSARPRRSRRHPRRGVGGGTDRLPQVDLTVGPEGARRPHPSSVTGAPGGRHRTRGPRPGALGSPTCHDGPLRRSITPEGDRIGLHGHLAVGVGVGSALGSAPTAAWGHPGEAAGRPDHRALGSPSGPHDAPVGGSVP